MYLLERNEFKTIITFSTKLVNLNKLSKVCVPIRRRHTIGNCIPLKNIYKYKTGTSHHAAPLRDTEHCWPVMEMFSEWHRPNGRARTRRSNPETTSWRTRWRCSTAYGFPSVPCCAPDAKSFPSEIANNAQDIHRAIICTSNYIIDTYIRSHLHIVVIVAQLISGVFSNYSPGMAFKNNFLFGNKMFGKKKL